MERQQPAAIGMLALFGLSGFIVSGTICRQYGGRIQFCQARGAMSPGLL